MGHILRQYYEYVLKEKGMEGKNKLAIMTKMSPIIAPLQPDNPENIKLFKEAVKTITGKDAPDLT
jgi:hypothetical protein